MLEQRKGTTNEEKMHRMLQGQEKRPEEVLSGLTLEGLLELAKQRWKDVPGRRNSMCKRPRSIKEHENFWGDGRSGMSRVAIYSQPDSAF